MKNKPLRVITIGDERLNQRSNEVEAFTPDLSNLVDEMFKTLDTKKGVGLAAVQVGTLTRVFITLLPDESPRVFVNPELIATSEDQVGIEEGCLSIPNKYETVIRPAAVTIQAYSLKGKPFTLSAEGFLARVVQHELDHLNGILFIDRLEQKKRAAILKSFKKKVAVG
ncbi:MAG TPA: peptide deformylase [Spirochaetia bacterium]|nr:peptide deformylase [Spirochaetia bacterium]